MNRIEKRNLHAVLLNLSSTPVDSLRKQKRDSRYESMKNLSWTRIKEIPWTGIKSKK